MATRQFDTTAEPMTRPAAARQASVSETAAPEQASPAQAVRRLSAHTVAAQLAQSSGGHLARAGHALLQLQRLHGNRYVQRVLGHTRGQPRPLPRPGTAPLIQTKLVVGPAGDRYEREADHLAEAVMRSLSSQDGATGDPELKPGDSVVSRKVPSAVDPLGGTSLDAGGEAAMARARSGGVALAPAVRSRMETAFGSDFGAVRIHQG
ncbi:MAG: eCIS core domain-containing protein, partial [Pseudonocardiaceae bacterium]